MHKLRHVSFVKNVVLLNERI